MSELVTSVKAHCSCLQTVNSKAEWPSCPQGGLSSPGLLSPSCGRVRPLSTKPSFPSSASAYNSLLSKEAAHQGLLPPARHVALPSLAVCDERPQMALPACPA